MVRGQYLILFSSLALLVISAHIPGGRAQADATSGDNRQLSSSQQTISREKRGETHESGNSLIYSKGSYVEFSIFPGVGLTSTGFGVMATGLVSLLSLSLSPELRRRVSNLEQLARAGPAPGAWSRRSVMIQTHDNADLVT